MENKNIKTFKNIIFGTFLFLIIFLLTIFYLNLNSSNNLSDNSNVNTNNNTTDNLNTQLINYDKINTLEDGTKYIIHPNEILSGGVPKGGIGEEKGIPALDENNINWETPKKANNWIKDNELIIKLNYNGETRIYPFQILVFHEIVNDKFGDKPVLVTYCPLCGTSIAYKREINLNNKKTETKFGVSGKLYNSNLIMYDKLTDTYWQQIEGNAILGELTGDQLTPIDTNTITWEDFKNSDDYNNENIKVLSQKTGMNRNYGRDPYGNYYIEDYLLFPPKIQNKNSKIHPKEIILGIKIGDKYKGYLEKSILDNKNKIIEDIFENTTIQITKSENNEITFKNKKTNQTIIKERNMFFSWYAFHPGTQIYNIN